MIFIDTNVLSELMRPVPDPAIASWVAERATLSLHLTAVWSCALASRSCRRADDGTIWRKDWNGCCAPASPIAFFRLTAPPRPPMRRSPSPARDGQADTGSRLPDRGHRPLAQHGGGDAQRAGLRGHGHRRDRSVGRRMNALDRHSSLCAIRLTTGACLPQGSGSGKAVMHVDPQVYRSGSNATLNAWKQRPG